MSKIQTCSNVNFDKDVSFSRVLCADVSFTIVHIAVVSFSCALSLEQNGTIYKKHACSLCIAILPSADPEGGGGTGGPDPPP